MTREQAKTLIHKLNGQLENGFQRVSQLENLGQNGLEHTIMREQINATLATLDWLREVLPAPLMTSDFHIVMETKNKWAKKFGWLGWM